MKLKRYVFGLLAVLLASTLFACGGDDSGNGNTDWVAPDIPMQVYVGSESLKFYQRKLDAYVEEKNLPFTIEVTGVDTGTYTDTFMRNPEEGPDIFIVAHDNLGKLLDGDGLIDPIESEDLINQIKATTDRKFQNAVYTNVAGGASKYYAVPVMRQALVLYYNTEYFSSPEECDTWEEIYAKAEATNTLAVSYTGNDGFNYSHWQLAKPVSEDAIEAFGEDGSLELFKAGLWSGNYVYGDDQVAIHSYAQRFTLAKNGRNGAVLGSDAGTGWKQELANHNNNNLKDVKGSITVIGGAWDVGSVDSSLNGKYGVTVLPTFTLTEADEYGKAKAGMVFQSGSYYDVKCLMKNKASKYKPFLDDILMYLSSEDMQIESYINCNNLPALKTFDAEQAQSIYDNLTDAERTQYKMTQTKVDLAKAQLIQGETAGLPQPFGRDADFNPAYYSKACKYFVEIHNNAEVKEKNEEGVEVTTKPYSTQAGILAALQKVSFTLANDRLPNNAKELEDWVAAQNR